MLARALARRASDHEKLVARPQNLLVPDDRTGLLSSSDFYMTKRYDSSGNSYFELLTLAAARHPGVEDSFDGATESSVSSVSFMIDG